MQYIHDDSESSSNRGTLVSLPKTWLGVVHLSDLIA